MKLKDRLSVTQTLFPEKSKKRYSKYNSKVKDSHLLLHKMGNDIGYPQEVLFKPRSASKSKDYQTLNKKKISDSALTPVQSRRISIQRQKYRLDPKKLLVYRKNQMKLKQSTKIHLQKDLQELPFTEPMEAVPKLIEAGFYRHRTRKQQSSLSTSTRMKKLNQTLGFGQSISQQLTLETMNRTEKVIGISSKQQMLKQKSKYRQPSMSKDKSNSIEKLILKDKQEDKIDWKSKRRFKQIIIKLKEYHKIFEGTVSQQQVELNIESQMLLEQKRLLEESARQKMLMQKIDDFARGKKEDIIWKNYQHINDLQDLKKVNPKFYEELTRSRKKRLQLLKLDLKRIEQISPQKKKNFKIRQVSEITSSIQLKTFTEEQEAPIQEYVNNTKWLEERSARRRQYQSISRFQKLRLFLSSFGGVRLSAQLFGVPIDMVYFSMLNLPEPFSMQGSYLFFKAVSSNDIETVQIFIQQFPKIIHEIDDLGRSCLIVSTQYNFTQMSKLLISVGMNLDIESIKGSALYNAIKNQNIQIVLLLLERGASPWSKNYDILQLNRSQQVYKLIKLSRKLSLGMNTMKPSRRYAFWQQVKHKLREEISN